MAHKYVYLFSEGNGTMRELLGGKGANLAEMTVLGMPVPQGFTISTKHVRNIMKTVVKLTMKFKLKSMSTYLKWKPFAKKNSVTPPILYWYLFAREPELLCRE